jgi:C1A family cysteine protease
MAGFSLSSYKNGVYNDCRRKLDHAVVLLGYKSGVGWKIKNSWGSSWGMNGFGWIS